MLKNDLEILRQARAAGKGRAAPWQRMLAPHLLQFRSFPADIREAGFQGPLLCDRIRLP
ncbi:hypothetical protein ACWKWV_04565 [Castellaniella ginsengisoli]